MSTIKTRVNEELIKDFISAHDGFTDDSKLETTEDGEVSQAYFFETETGPKVLRVNATSDEGFRKDGFAARHFAGEHLPVPKIEEVGQLDNGMYFAVSARAPGKTLDTFSKDELANLMPSIITTLEAIHNTPPIGEGYGWINLEGIGVSETWIDALDQKQHEEDDASLIDCPFFETELVADVRTRIKQLYEFCPVDVRQLYHGDYGFNNTLSDGKVITGVIDWHSAAYGDPLYDVAWLDFWDENQGYADAFRQYYLDNDRLPKNYDQRLLCYKLMIGANSMAFFAKSYQEDKYRFAKQVVEEL